MDTCTELFGAGELARLRRRHKRWIIALTAVGAAALAACVTFCALTRTGNAARMELSAVAVSTAAGWFILYCARFVVRRDRGEIGHAHMLLTGERVPVTGFLELAPETVRIPGGVELRRVWVTDGDKPQRLSVLARKAAALEAVSGRRVTLYTVNGFAAAYEVCHEDP